MTASKPTDIREFKEVYVTDDMDEVMGQDTISGSHSTAGIAYIKKPDHDKTTKFIEYRAVEQLRAELAHYKNGTQIKEIHYDEPVHIIAENNKLREQVRDYEQALKYYGDKSKWFEKDNSICIDDDDTELSDYVKQLGADEYGGKRARNVLKKWSGV